jgi:DNA repair exonuclease SbcCD ATPase subunit
MDISDLSGGEKSRVTLAYNLALAEVFGSPVLMIDEGLNGLQTDLRDDSVQMLKDVSFQKLVLVVQHGIDHGEFDSVINF